MQMDSSCKKAYKMEGSGLMKYCRHLLGVLLATFILTAMQTTTVWAVDENDRNGDGYHDGDMAVINAFAERVGENGGADWSRVRWNLEVVGSNLASATTSKASSSYDDEAFF